MHQQARGCDVFEATLTRRQDIASSVMADKNLWTAALPACLSLGALGIPGQGSIRTLRDIAPCLCNLPVWDLEWFAWFAW